MVDGEFLMQLQSKSKNLKRSYDELVADPQAATLVQQLRDLRQKSRTNHASQRELKSDLQRASESEAKLEEQIATQLESIEDFVKELAGSAPKLELG